MGNTQIDLATLFRKIEHSILDPKKSKYEKEEELLSYKDKFNSLILSLNDRIPLDSEEPPYKDNDFRKSCREIQHLFLDDSVSDSEKELRIDFCKSIFTTFSEHLDVFVFQTIIPISFAKCPIDEAKHYARFFGMHIIEGSSSNYYLSFSKGVES